MNFTPFRIRLLAALALLSSVGSLSHGEVLWELNGERSENGQNGWKVDRGSLTLEEGGAMSVEPESGVGFRMYRYVDFDFSDAGQPYRYLQIKAHAPDERAIGIVTDVSGSGGMIGVWAPGVTTLDLANAPSLRPKLGKKGQWALSLYAGKPFVIESVVCSATVDNGIVFELADGSDNGVVTEGDTLRIKAFTSDPELAAQQQLHAELICRNKQAGNTIAIWNSAGGPNLTLTRVGEGQGEGHFEAEITIDSPTAALMSASNGPAMLGVRLLGGSVPLYGWAALSTEDDPQAALIDWNDKIGEPTESRAVWEELTRGEELARGRAVHFVPKPDYRLTTDENDPFDLTDGQLSSRTDDRIWFNKDAVGWYLNTNTGARQIAMIVDLGTVQPVGQIAIRLLAGKEQPGLRLPNQIEFLASENGEDYHQLQSMVKLMAAEASLSDFKKAFYVPEDGKAFMQAFSCGEPVNARYIAIRVTPEAAVFTDEISILKADAAQQAKSVASFPATTLLTSGIAFKPRQPILTITEGALTPNWFIIEEGEQQPYKTLSLELSLPEGITFAASDFFEPGHAEHDTENGTRTYRFDGIEKLKRRNFNIYLKSDPSHPTPASSKAKLVSYIDGVVSHTIEAPVQVLQIPQGPYPEHLDISLAWLHEATQARWPEFVESFRRMGFGFMSTFPRFWQHRNAARSWNEESKRRGLEVIETARKNSYRIVMNDSPFAEMKHTIVANLAAGTIDDAEKSALLLQNPDGTSMDLNKGDYFNPFYRGKFYQGEMERIEELVRLTKPDHIYWDIEIWWRSAARAQNDPRIRRAWESSGKPWEEYLATAGTEMLRDLQNAVQRAMGGNPLPVIGLYGAFASQAHPTDGLMEWSEFFPDSVQISMPSLYVQGRVSDVSSRIRDEVALVGRDVIPWLTPGTYGPVDPPAVEAMVLETILNGARGFTYYEYADFDPLHFYYHTKALSTLGKFRELLKHGKPTGIKGSNAALRTTLYASGDEALLLVGNYARTPETATKIPLPPPFAKARSVSTEEGEIALKDGALHIAVPAGEQRLYHLTR